MAQCTIKDVAKLARVSTQTVSRVINGKAEIRPETRAHVLAVMHEIGYRPNANARSLSGKGTQSIGVSVPDITNPFHAEIIAAMVGAAHDRGYHIFVDNTGGQAERERASIQLLAERRADGVLLCSSSLPDELLVEMLGQGQAVVLVNRRLDHSAGAQIRADYTRGGYLATRHLLECGHRKIGALTLRADTVNARDKLEGYFAALREWAVMPDPALVSRGTADARGGYDATKAVLAASPHATAIFVYSEAMAVGTLRACAELGRRVPDDIALIAFGGGTLSAMLTPSLSTIRLPLAQIGRQAFEMVWQVSNGQTPTPLQVLVEPSLVARESSVPGLTSPVVHAHVAASAE